MDPFNAGWLSILPPVIAIVFGALYQGSDLFSFDWYFIRHLHLCRWYGSYQPFDGDGSNDFQTDEHQSGLQYFDVLHDVGRSGLYHQHGRRKPCVR